MSASDAETGSSLELEPAPASQGLAGRARLAIAWTTGFQLFRDLLQFGLTLTLVRLLPAEAYGQFGFVTTLLSFLTLYSFREFLNHTLQIRDGEPVPYQDHFTAGAVIQTSLFVVTNVIAIGLRYVPDFAPASPLLHVMSILFLLDLPSEFRVKMLERTLDWRRLRLLHAAALVAGAALSITLALLGWGVYALLLPTLLVPLPFMYDLFVRERWRPAWTWHRDRYRGAWKYGSSRVLGVSFVSLAGVLESTWLTRLAGFAVLGLFGRAVVLGNLVCGRLGGLLAQSVFPVLTRIQPRTDSYRRASALYLRTILWVVIPAAAIGAQLADPIVAILYGRAWADVVPMLPWAMAASALLAVVQTAYTLLLAHGRQDSCLKADIWRLVGTVAILAALLPRGIQAYLMGVVIVHTVSLTLVIYWLIRAEALTPRALRDACVPPVLSAAVASLAVALGRSWLPSLGRTDWPALLYVAAFGVMYVALLRVLYRGPLQELVDCLPRRQRLSRLLRLQEAS